MKLYVRSSEKITAARTIEQLQEQEGKGLPKQVFNQLIAVDPTSDAANGKGGKYCPWILRMYKNESLKKEDFTNLKDALEMFVKDYKKYPKQDIGQYKSVEEFLADTEAVGNRELTDKEKKKMLKKQAHQAGDSDREFLVRDGEWEVWKPLTYAGSISLAREGGEKASWCTAYEGNDHYWNSYTRQGPLYIFLKDNDPTAKMQLHFPTDSWYDFNDRSRGMDAFYTFCSEHPKIGKLFEIKSEGGLLTRAGEVVQYDAKAEEIIIPEGVTRLPDFRFPEACKKVVIPDSMTDIAAGAFRGSNVETVVANNIQKIGANAFRESAITNIDLSTVTKIGSSSFRNCKNLHDLDLNPDEVSIGSYAFAENLFTDLTVSPSMKLFMGAFDACEDLVVTWAKEDEPFEFSQIKMLVLAKDKCPELFETNKGYVTIKTTSGEVFEADKD